MTHVLCVAALQLTMYVERLRFAEQEAMQAQSNAFEKTKLAKEVGLWNQTFQGLPHFSCMTHQVAAVWVSIGQQAACNQLVVTVLTSYSCVLDCVVVVTCCCVL
jgi:hypothetical protein